MAEDKDPILLFCDQAAAIVNAKAGVGCAESVFLPVNTDPVSQQELPIVEVKDVRGRRVYAYPKAATQKDTATRKKDLMAYTVGVQVYEVFDAYRLEAGFPSRAWCNERVTFVMNVRRWLSNPRKGGTTFTGVLAGAYPDEGNVDLVFDPELLRKQKVFWSVLSFTYVLEVDPS